MFAVPGLFSLDRADFKQLTANLGIEGPTFSVAFELQLCDCRKG